MAKRYTARKLKNAQKKIRSGLREKYGYISGADQVRRIALGDPPEQRPSLDATDDQRYLGVDAQTRERDVEKRKSQRRGSGKRAGPRKNKRSSARSAAKRRR